MGIALHYCAPVKQKSRTVSSRLNETNRFNWTGGVKISLGRHGSGLMALPKILKFWPYQDNLLWHRRNTFRK